MNKQQKEILQTQLDSEKKTINELKQVYNQALKDVNEKISLLSARADMNPPELQSIIYQKQYQQAIKGQLEGVMANLQSNEYATISDYLTRCYQDGYIGTMYDLQGQGIPLVIPIDQEQVAKAIQIDSKLSKPLYNRLSEDVSKLKTSVRAEISRGIANGSSWVEVGEKISKSMKNTPFEKSINNSIRIARTEGHRIQNAATLDAQHKAKEKGANIIKQWDSTLDGATRDTHRQLDGQIREIDEDFEVNGLRASAPGMFGDPAEDCNCRCALLQRARWALDETELDTLKERAEYFGLDKSKDFEEFKSKYFDISEKDIVKTDKTDIIISGARITNPESERAREFAKMYYEEIRSFSTDTKKIAKNLDKEETDIKKIKSYLFEDKSFVNPETGEKRQFDPDCAIAQSWQRLIIGRDIKKHDYTLIEHELLEMKIKKENPNMEHWEAHEQASRKYNYTKEVVEYYGNLKKYKKEK